MDDELPAPLDLRDANDDELAAFALRKDVAWLCDELHAAVYDGLDAATLHGIVELWELNHEDVSFGELVERGRPSLCADCATDVAPYDEGGRVVEEAWQWFMLEDAIWREALAARGPARFLCIACLEQRLGRSLCPADFSDLLVNRPRWSQTPRLRALLTQREASGTRAA